MRKTKKQHEEDMLKAIKGKKIYCFKDIFIYYSGISRQYAYEIKLDKSDKIREIIDYHKQNGKVSMLRKWIDGDNATLQLAAMRLIGDEDTRKKLNQQYIDHTSDKKQIVFNLNTPNEDNH